jgi:hypothetical protein
MKPWASRSYSLSEREIYSAVSTVLGSQNLAADELGASIVDTAICAKPGELLQDNCFMGIQCIAAISCRLEARIVIAMHKHATCPAKKSTTLPATREAGLVQIAKARF